MKNKFFVAISICLVSALVIFTVMYNQNVHVVENKHDLYNTPNEAITANLSLHSGYQSCQVLKQLEIDNQQLNLVAVTYDEPKMVTFTALNVYKNDNQYYAEKAIEDYRIDGSSNQIITGELEVKHKKIPFKIGRMGDNIKEVPNDFQNMEEYDNHIFFSYGVTF